MKAIQQRDLVDTLSDRLSQPEQWLGFMHRLCPAVCSDDIVGVASSADGTRRAVVSVRNCGATTSFVTRVEVSRDVLGIPGRRDLVFVADSDHGVAPLTASHAIPLRVEWVSNARLRISYDHRARVYDPDARVGSVDRI